MAEHAYFNFADQKVVSADFLFLNQAQLAQLLKMMVRHAWAAKVQGALDFPHTHRLASFEQEPVDFPRFTLESVLKLILVSHGQSARRLTHKTEQATYKSNCWNVLFL